MLVSRTTIREWVFSNEPRDREYFLLLARDCSSLLEMEVRSPELMLHNVAQPDRGVDFGKLPDGRATPVAAADVGPHWSKPLLYPGASDTTGCPSAAGAKSIAMTGSS